MPMLLARFGKFALGRLTSNEMEFEHTPAKPDCIIVVVELVLMKTLYAEWLPGGFADIPRNISHGRHVASTRR